MRVRRFTTSLSALILAASLTSCGGDDDPPTKALDKPKTDEVAAHPEICPKRLAEDAEGTNADSLPSFPAPDQGWICRYDSSDSGPGPDGDAVFNWTLAEPARPVFADQVTALMEEAEHLEPPPSEQMCTADLGPRYLLVTASGQDLSGLLVDDFGCRDVRATDDPFTDQEFEHGPYVGRPSLIEGLRVAWNTDVD